MRHTIRHAAKAVALAAAALAVSAGSANAAQLATVSEQEGMENTGISVSAGQRVTLDATGDMINPGVIFTSKNGPAGYFGILPWAGSDFPLPGARKYSLLVKLAGKTRYVGTGTTFIAPNGGTLYLQINDNEPGTGSGHFGAYVSVS